MGSGKTTFGKWIAANKKMEFLDTDELIEKENGITISDILHQRVKYISEILRQKC